MTPAATTRSAIKIRTTRYDELIVSRRRIADPSVATPNAPDSTTVSVNGPAVDVSWRSNGNGKESQVKIECCIGFHYECDYSQSFTQNCDRQHGETKFTDSGVQPNTTYTYRVRARDRRSGGQHSRFRIQIFSRESVRAHECD
jgi:hypothetical protein